ncbi:MAG: hypothetical protein WC765_10785 [Phycisphaerae bacterium]|jgi:hypothetical protein
MDISFINSQSLLHLLSLAEKKEELIQLLEQIDAEIIKTLKGGLFVGGDTSLQPSIVPPAPALNKPVAAAPTKTESSVKPAKKAKKSKGGKSGGLKDRILALLEAAGDEGLRVKDIAAKLGAKATNISVWFSTTGKHLTTKLAPGLFAKKGASKPTVVAPIVPAPKAAKPAKAKKKSGISPEGRARIAAATKARWAARRAGKFTAPAKTPKA